MQAARHAVGLNLTPNLLGNLSGILPSVQRVAFNADNIEMCGRFPAVDSWGMSPMCCIEHHAGFALIAKFVILRRMSATLKQKVMHVCNEKIAAKGDSVGLSFYAFFANKNDNPEWLTEAAEWWIHEHRFDDFETAVKRKRMIDCIASEAS